MNFGAQPQHAVHESFLCFPIKGLDQSNAITSFKFNRVLMENSGLEKLHIEVTYGVRLTFQCRKLLFVVFKTKIVIETNQMKVDSNVVENSLENFQKLRN